MSLEAKNTIYAAREAAIEHKGVKPFIWQRYSPRAMSGEKVSQENLMTLFEAARWAPSNYNGQPWRFVWARNGTPAWNKFFGWLVPFNQGWCKNGDVLVLVLSKKTFEYNGQPNMAHGSDTGAAWENLALQGQAMDLVVHGMGGFDAEAARKDLNIPADYEIHMMFVVGHPGDARTLPVDLQAGEIPNVERKRVTEFTAEDNFIW